jgi:hypothetical protein
MSELKIIDKLKCLGPFEIDLSDGKILFWDVECWGSVWLTYEQIGDWIEDLKQLRRCIEPREVLIN